MADAMVREMNQRHGRHVSGLADSILDACWRMTGRATRASLRNTIERAVILCPDGAPLDAGHLPRTFGTPQVPAAHTNDAGVVPIRVGTTVDEAERIADFAHTGIHWPKQDAGGGDSWSKSQDPAQQAQGIQPFAGRPARLRFHR